MLLAADSSLYTGAHFCQHPRLVWRWCVSGHVPSQSHMKLLVTFNLVAESVWQHFFKQLLPIDTLTLALPLNKVPITCWCCSTNWRLAFEVTWILPVFLQVLMPVCLQTVTSQCCGICRYSNSLRPPPLPPTAMCLYHMHACQPVSTPTHTLLAYFQILISFPHPVRP